MQKTQDQKELLHELKFAAEFIRAKGFRDEFLRELEHQKRRELTHRDIKAPEGEGE